MPSYFETRYRQLLKDIEILFEQCDTEHSINKKLEEENETLKKCLKNQDKLIQSLFTKITTLNNEKKAHEFKEVE